MKYQILIVFILGLILQSCAFYGLTNDYSKLDIEQQKIIEKFDLSKEVKTNHIYEISATQLKEELKNHKKSIVYLFANGCSSKYCLPLNVYVNYAKDNGYYLFLVMNGYGNLSQTLSQKISLPLYAIDAQAYDTKWNNKYVKRFENQLQGLPQDSKQQYKGSIYFFEEDSLVSIKRGLPN